MNTRLKIESLINKLPDKDGVICHKYLQQGDYNSIKEIVVSDVRKYNKNKTKYDYYNIEDIEELLFLIEPYCEDDLI